MNWLNPITRWVNRIRGNFIIDNLIRYKKKIVTYIKVFFLIIQASNDLAIKVLEKKKWKHLKFLW